MALSAAQYALLKLNLRAFTSANRYTVANLSESDLLSFWNQLITEASGASTLPAIQDAAVDGMFRSLLCSSSNTFLRLADADWTSFFTQLATDATGAAVIPTPQYEALKLQLRAQLSGYKVTPFNLSNADLLGYIKARAGFSGNFGALFTGVLQYLRGDLGITQSTGNITGWADQSGNGADVTTAGSSTQIGTVGTGLNGHASVIADGVNHGGQYSLDLPAPGTTPTFLWIVWRQLSNAGASPSWLSSDDGGACAVQVNVTNDLYMNNSIAIGPITTTNNTWTRLEAAFSNSAGNRLKLGSATATGSAGNTDPGATRGIFSRPTGFNRLNAEMLVHIVLNNIPSQPTLDAASAAVTSYYGGTVAV